VAPTFRQVPLPGPSEVGAYLAFFSPQSSVRRSVVNFFGHPPSILDSTAEGSPTQRLATCLAPPPRNRPCLTPCRRSWCVSSSTPPQILTINKVKVYWMSTLLEGNFSRPRFFLCSCNFNLSSARDCSGVRCQFSMLEKREPTLLPPPFRPFGLTIRARAVR